MSARHSVPAPLPLPLERQAAVTIKRLLWPAIAAVAMLGVLGLMLALTTPRDSGPTAAGTEEPSPPDAAHPAPPGAWRSATWQPIGNPFVPHEPPILRIDGLVGSHLGFDGWGRIPAPGQNEFGDVGAVFHSPDGLEWTVVPIDHGVNGLSTSEIRGVAVGPLGLVAWGGVCCAPEQPAMWHSPDAATWTRLEIELNPMPRWVHDVVAMEDLWVAVGTLADGTGRIWVSADGATWEAVLETEAGLPGIAISDLARTPDGLVAVGTVTGSDGTYDGAAWTSADGRRWERIPDPTGLLAGDGEVALDGVVSFGERLLLIGLFGTSEQRRVCDQLGMVASTEKEPLVALSCGWGTDHLWLLDEGGAWQRIDLAEVDELHPVEFRHAVAGGPGLLVLGESSAPASPDTMLFASPDGVEWSVVKPALPVGMATPMAMTIADERIVVVADRWDESASELRVWIAESD